MSYPYLTQFKKVIDATSELSDASKKAYKDRLRRLTEMTSHDVDWIIMHPDAILERLQKYELQTQKSYINSILTLFRYTKNLKKKRRDVYDKWYKIFSKVHVKADEKYNTMEASDRQKQVYVAWAQILERRDELAKDSAEYLLLCLYTMIPPSRADMNCVKIYSDEQQVNVKKYPNHMIVGADKITLIYNEFKSKSRRLQKYEKILPGHLESIVRQSLKSKPREFLIVSPRTGKPYDNAGSFTRYFDRILERVFKKRVTINTLRHSFINSLDLNKLTPHEKDVISREMMHSRDMMDKYRLFVPAAQSNTGVDLSCEVVCKSRQHNEK